MRPQSWKPDRGSRLSPGLRCVAACGLLASLIAGCTPSGKADNDSRNGFYTGVSAGMPGR